jgi:hypothetical protein
MPRRPDAHAKSRRNGAYNQPAAGENRNPPESTRAVRGTHILDPKTRRHPAAAISSHKPSPTPPPAPFVAAALRSLSPRSRQPKVSVHCLLARIGQVHPSPRSHTPSPPSNRPQVYLKPRCRLRLAPTILAWWHRTCTSPRRTCRRRSWSAMTARAKANTPWAWARYVRSGPPGHAAHSRAHCALGAGKDGLLRAARGHYLADDDGHVGAAFAIRPHARTSPSRPRRP